jgi:hypothetical protein
MFQVRYFGIAACVLLSLPGVVAAQDQEYEIRWSASLEAAFHKIASHESDGDVTGFFDQYQFTPNKDNVGGLEFGLTEAMFDLFGEEETPILRFRLASPTSNLGLGQNAVEHPFLNQRAELFATHNGLFLDVDYRRMRTENLRRFPDPNGSALTFTDLTGPGDRFYKERTGFDASFRFRPQDRFEDLPGAIAALNGELELRGGYEVRNGERQQSFILAPTNDWLSVDPNLDQDVGTIGGALRVAPGGLFTLTLDIDYQRFREGASTRTDASLGAPFPSSSQTIGFVPDTDRTSGALRIRRRFGDRAEIRAGFQVTLLEQVSRRTPDQQSAGLDDNYLLLTSANVVTDVELFRGLSASAFFKYDERNNRIDRSTALFNTSGGSQVDEFVDRLRRIVAGGEIIYSFMGHNQVSAGVKTEWVDRDLDFVPPAVGQRILEANALVSDETQMVAVYGRTRLNPFAGFDFRGEVGYREAPKTGYVIDLDDYWYGSANASYSFPIRRPVMLSAFVRGSTGENHDFKAVDGLGPSPTGDRVDRDFERTEIYWGVSVAASPWKNVTLFSTFFQSRDTQDYDLVHSDFPRFYQDFLPLTFAQAGPVDYHSNGIGVLSSANVHMNKNTDIGLTYSFNRIKTRYRGGGSGSGAVTTIENLSRIDSDIHRVGVTLGHRLRKGLRVTAGYRFEIYEDDSPVHGTGVVQPFDLGTYQHTVTLGITLSNGLFD